MEIKTTMMVAGAAYLQYLPHPIGCPFFEDTEIPTTFAEAPIGVALPPISVPIASAQESVSKSTPCSADKLLITGIMVAANGILSTNALANAEIQMIIATINFVLEPLTLLINSAITVRTPVYSKPPTTTKSPTKNSSVL